MPATANSRGMLKAATNRVRTSASIQGSDMWESVIGLKNDERGANAGVEALLNAPRVKQGMVQARKSRQTAAAEAMKVTGNFNTEVSDYDSLIRLAKEQGAVGNNERRGACKVCGQVGHLTKQCRNQFSKYFTPPDQAAKTALTNYRPNSDDESLTSLSDSDSQEKRTRRKKRRRQDKTFDKGSLRKSRHQGDGRRRHRHEDDRKRSKSKRGYINGRVVDG